MSELTVGHMLRSLQMALVVPKERFNKFGNYHYRSCEDIVNAVKSILPEGCSFFLSDEIEMKGDRFYVKATATFSYQDKTISANGYARESLEKKGMDAAQLTGSCSSYARKYALCGLFAIDDSVDADGEAAGYPAPESSKAKPKMISEEGVRCLSNLMAQLNYDENKLLSRYNNANTLLDLTDVQYEHALKGLNSLLKPKE